MNEFGWNWMDHGIISWNGKDRHLGWNVSSSLKFLRIGFVDDFHCRNHSLAARLVGYMLVAS